jgi:hypothetical protein
LPALSVDSTKPEDGLRTTRGRSRSPSSRARSKSPLKTQPKPTEKEEDGKSNEEEECHETPLKKNNNKVASTPRLFDTPSPSPALSIPVFQKPPGVSSRFLSYFFSIYHLEI